MAREPYTHCLNVVKITMEDHTYLCDQSTERTMIRFTTVHWHEKSGSELTNTCPTMVCAESNNSIQL